MELPSSSIQPQPLPSPVQTRQPQPVKKQTIEPDLSPITVKASKVAEETLNPKKLEEFSKTSESPISTNSHSNLHLTQRRKLSSTSSKVYEMTQKYEKQVQQLAIKVSKTQEELSKNKLSKVEEAKKQIEASIPNAKSSEQKPLRTQRQDKLKEMQDLQTTRTQLREAAKLRNKVSDLNHSSKAAKSEEQNVEKKTFKTLIPTDPEEYDKILKELGSDIPDIYKQDKIPSYEEFMKQTVKSAPTPYTAPLNTSWSELTNNTDTPIQDQTIFQVLLKPTESEARQDFLMYAKWMPYGKADNNRGNPGLVNEMQRIFNQMPANNKDKEALIAEQKAILQFAKDLIEKGVYSKASMQDLIDLAQKYASNSEELKKLIKDLIDVKDPVEAKTDKGNRIELLNQNIKELKEEINRELDAATNFTEGETTGETLTKFSKVDKMRSALNSLFKARAELEGVTIKEDHVSASTKFNQVVRNKKEDMQQYARELADDIATLSGKILAQSLHSEYQDLAFEKNPTPFSSFSNKLMSFVTNQILANGEDPTQSVRAYSIFVRVAEELVARGDYNSAEMIYASLNQSMISRMNLRDGLPREIRKKEDQLTALFDTKNNYRTLRTHMQARLDRGESIIPEMVILQRDFTQAAENSRKLANGNPNFGFVGVVKKIHQQLDAAIHSQSKRNTLHYDLINDLELPRPNEDKQYEISRKIAPRGTKLVRTVLGNIKRVAEK